MSNYGMQGFLRGKLTGEYSLKKRRGSVHVCSSCVVVEIGDLFDHKVEGIKYAHADLAHITDSGYSDMNGDFQPIIRSNSRPGADETNAIAMLEIFSNQTTRSAK